MSEGHIAPSRADHGSMGGKPPVNRYLPVSPEQANTGISVTSDLLWFFSPLRPIPDHVPIRDSTGGESTGNLYLSVPPEKPKAGILIASELLRDFSPLR